MAARPPVPSCVRAVMAGLNGTTKWANVLYLKYSSTAPTATDLVTVGSDISSAWQTNFGSIMGTQVTVTSVTVTDLANNTGAQGISTIGRSGAHTPANPLPVNCAVVLSFGINLRYRGGHPRMYLPARDWADTSNGNLWTSTYQGLVQTSGTNFVNALNAITVGANSYSLQAVSYYTNKTLRPQGVPYPVTSVTVHPRIDSMRRRLGKEIR